MELLEGESLRARLASGPLPLRKAVDIAAQIAHGWPPRTPNTSRIAI